jgi:hypothetical protein
MVEDSKKFSPEKYEVNLEEQPVEDVTFKEEETTCVAVSLYGANSEEVRLLRRLRDEVLNRTAEGQEIIKLYYQLSPFMVSTMKGDAGFNGKVKDMIDVVLPIISAEVE